MTKTIAGVAVPDSKLAQDIDQLVRDTESDLLYHHSNRVFLFGALAGRRKGLTVDPELLYAGAMFHDMGLQPPFASATERFEVDGANAAADFLRSRGIGEREVEDVWDAIALHTTPGIPQHKRPVVALVTAGVEMDVLGLDYEAFTAEQRHEVCTCHPRGTGFKQCIIEAFAKGTIDKPATTFGNVKADVLARLDPTYRRVDFTEVILNSKWRQ